MCRSAPRAPLWAAGNATSSRRRQRSSSSPSNREKVGLVCVGLYFLQHPLFVRERAVASVPSRAIGSFWLPCYGWSPGEAGARRLVCILRTEWSQAPGFRVDMYSQLPTEAAALDESVEAARGAYSDAPVPRKRLNGRLVGVAIVTAQIEAATKIQSGFRGFRARRHLDELVHRHLVDDAQAERRRTARRSLWRRVFCNCCCQVGTNSEGFPDVDHMRQRGSSINGSATLNTGGLQVP